MVGCSSSHHYLGSPASASSQSLSLFLPKATTAIPAFDTDTSGLTICPWPSSRGRHGKPFLASVGGKLLALVHPCFDVLGAPPQHDSDKPWSWTTITKPPPFVTSRIRCYAVRPDGRTLFVSAESHHFSWAPKQKSTFSLDTERLEWTHHGDWLLPFRGQAYYDNELDAWVGLCCHDDGAGYVCCCDVPPVAAEFTSQPSWKLGKEKLFDTKSALHLGATLVYMGNSKFCLVESIARKDEEHIRIERHDFLPPRRVLCTTTFGLKYDKAGELIATTQRARSCRKYTAANDLRDPQWNPVAFWI